MNIYGLLVVLIYLLFCLVVSKFCYDKGYLSQYFSRKLLHILLSNIFLWLITFVDHFLLAISLPFLFIFINFLIHRYHLFKAIEQEQDSPGIIYYAISFFIITFLSYSLNRLSYGALSLLILGYGDGLAGLIGATIGKHPLHHKTWEGSITLFISVFLLCFLFSLSLPLSFTIATLSMFIELLSKKGLDNLFLPLNGFLFLLLSENYSLIPSFFFALSLHLWLGLIAYQGKKLTFAGSIGAILIGMGTYLFLGTIPFLALLFFLVDANVIEKFRNRKAKKSSAEPRHFSQVLANGLIAFLCASFFAISSHPIWLILFFVSLAASNSDTLSGEIGMLGGEKVKSLIRRIDVPKGSSGGVTKLGFFGGFLGSFLIALFSLFLTQKFSIFLFVTIFGFCGTIIDSLLGEFLEAKYYDPFNKKVKEELTEGCFLFSGYRKITNNVVNFTSNLITCLLATIAYFIVF